MAIVDVGSFYEITEGNRTQIPGLTYINSLVFPNGHGNTLTIFDLPTEPQAVRTDRCRKTWESRTLRDNRVTMVDALTTFRGKPWVAGTCLLLSYANDVIHTQILSRLCSTATNAMAYHR